MRVQKNVGAVSHNPNVDLVVEELQGSVSSNLMAVACCCCCCCKLAVARDYSAWDSLLPTPDWTGSGNRHYPITKMNAWVYYGGFVMPVSRERFVLRKGFMVVPGKQATHLRSLRRTLLLRGRTAATLLPEVLRNLDGIRTVDTPCPRSSGIERPRPWLTSTPCHIHFPKEGRLQP